MGIRDALISVADGYIIAHNYSSCPDVRGCLLHDIKDYMRKAESLMRDWYGINIYGIELARAVIERAKDERIVV